MKFHIRVHPGSSQERLIRNSDKSFTAYLTKRAVKDEANQALIKLLAKQFSMAKSKIKILKGRKSKFKMIAIE